MAEATTKTTADDSTAKTPPARSGTTPVSRDSARGHATPRGAWWLGFILIAGLLSFHLFIDFRGLSEAKGMEQAQVARELAQGNGFRTLVINPLSLLRADEHGDEISMAAMPATGMGPLNPLLNAGLIKLAGRDRPASVDARVYFPDRLIAALASLFFVGAVAVTFFLVRRLFDNTVATTTALLLLLSDLLWKFSSSGLAQMLAMFLTMAALAALARAIERSLDAGDNKPTGALAMCGLCCGLLVLALPLAISLVVGFGIFVAFRFRGSLAPLGVFVALTVLVASPWWVRNAMTPGSGGVFGFFEARLSSPAGGDGEKRLLRAFDAHDQALDRVSPTKKFVQQCGVQLAGLWNFTGGSVAALLFFLSLLHPFRSPLVASLRWALLAAWLAACFAMALAGLEADQAVDPAALHVLFLPVFSAYGVAFAAVLWNRTALADNRYSLWKHAHLVALVALTSAPLLIELPGRLILAERAAGRLVHWPPFDAFTMGKIAEWSQPDALIASDLPEAVAWYSDRMTLRLPMSPQTCSALFDRAQSDGAKPFGLYFSAAAVDRPVISGILHGDYRAWSALLLKTEPDATTAELLKNYQLNHWLNLSPSANQRAWLVTDQAYWQQKVDR